MSLRLFTGLWHWVSIELIWPWEHLERRILWALTIFSHDTWRELGVFWGSFFWETEHNKAETSSLKIKLQSYISQISVPMTRHWETGYSEGRLNGSCFRGSCPWPWAFQVASGAGGKEAQEPRCHLPGHLWLPHFLSLGPAITSQYHHRLVTKQIFTRGPLRDILHPRPVI